MDEDTDFLKLLFVTGSLVHGGAERHSITLMNRLTERGHECHAVYVKNDPSQLGRIRLQGNGTVHCLGARRYIDLRALMDFSERIRRTKPSAIVAANPYALMYSWIARRLSGSHAPVIVTYHTTKLLGIKEQLQMLLYRIFFRTSARCIFVCENQLKYWVPRGVFSRETEVIHNGIDTEHFSNRWSEQEVNDLRTEHGYNAGDFVIGLSAVLRPEKNHVQLVDAVAGLRQRGISACALMIGDGPTRQQVEQRAIALGIEKNIRISGFVQDVRPYLSICDVVVLCSVAVETFSLAAIEAMALKKPVGHADIGGASEMIFEGQNGFLFPVGDTQSLIEKLMPLAVRSTARIMGDKARNIVETLFSESRMVDRYEQMLLKVHRASQ